MHVLTGKFKNHPLKTPKGSQTRPTTTKVRQSLFNILQGQFEGCSFLDLFAGSGSIGIEALSQGAEEVVFVEKHPLAIQALKANLASLNVHAKLLKLPALVAIDKLQAMGKLFNVIFLDPPYDLDISSLLAKLPPLLTSEGLVIAEQSKHAKFDVKGLKQTDARAFGDTVLYFYTPAPFAFGENS